MTEVKAFCGDRFLAKHIDRLKEMYSLETAVETGTYKGQTTRWLCEKFHRVITIEENKGAFQQASEKLAEFNNVQIILGDSSKVLIKFLPKTNNLIYLDAHWNQNPLLEELRQIGLAVKRGMPLPVIAIHDFQVPEHPEFGYDSYPEITYRWPCIETAVQEIGSFYHYYNDQAEGSKRGCIFIVPKQLPRVPYS
jgi:hypothetical protein